MSICPECGENAATTDIFCSYCGITLTPDAAGGVDELSAPIDSPPDPVSSAEVPATTPATPEDIPIPPPIPSPFASGGGVDPFAMPVGRSDEGTEPEISTAADPIAIVEPEISAEMVAENDIAVSSEQELALEPAPESETKASEAELIEPQPQPSVESPEPGETESEITVSSEQESAPVSDAKPSDAEPIDPKPQTLVESPGETESAVAEFAPQQDSMPVLVDDVPTPRVILDLAAGKIGEADQDQDVLPATSPNLDTPIYEIEEPSSEIESAPSEIVAQTPVVIDADAQTPPADPVAEETFGDSVGDQSEEMKTGVEPISDSGPEAAAVVSPPANEVPPLEAAVVPLDVFNPKAAAGPDPDSVETLETPAPEIDDQPAATDLGALVAAPASEVRASTLPNIGNADTDGRKASKLNPLAEGTVLNNRYEIVRKIGGGGMGAVYLASDRNLGGILRAVKEMVQSYIESEQQEKAIADFQREAMILTNLEHPAIPTIYDYFYDDKEGRFYLVMKYISGGDLAARLRANPEGRLDEKTITEWAIQVADVLEYLHRQDPVIVYRDLKPANIMIDGNTGRLMLIDFGIARSINKEEKGVTAVGTMGYAPPELFSGNVEPRSDIYSLGSTIFHLLTGADPQSNPLLIFDFQKNPRPRQINPQLSDQIEQILMRSVEYNADLRFKSALEMKRALEEHLINLQAGKVSFGVKAAPSAVGFSEQLVFCGFCGKQIIASDVFCAFCGSQQPIAQQSFHQIPVKAAGMTAKLFVVLTNDLESAGFTLEKDDNLIGRRDPMSNIFPEVDLSKYDPQTKISRRHARIRLEGASFLLEDLGSSNGTILMTGAESARLLPHQQRLLTDGDRIRVGDTTLQFSIS